MNRRQRAIVAAPFVLAALALSVAPADAKAIVVKGQVGVIGEWALQASLDTSDPPGHDQAYSGVLNLRHVGFCSISGPEEKTGRLTAPIHDGVADHLTLAFGTDICVYPGPVRLSTKVSRGFMRCRSGFQVPISLWSSP